MDETLCLISLHTGVTPSNLPLALFFFSLSYHCSEKEQIALLQNFSVYLLGLV